MKRVAVYCGTRNQYQRMVTAAKSLLYHNGADQVFFLIEDDQFPEPLPPCIECINVSNQSFFPHDGPNYNCVWSYMILLRGAFTKIFPQYDIILSLDNDTIVNGNISGLWNTDLTGFYYAAVRELHSVHERHETFYNAGVMLLNLHALRDGKDNEIIHKMNTEKHASPEQDIYSSCCSGKIKSLPPEYNSMIWNVNSEGILHSRIIHYASSKDYCYQFPVFNKFRHMPWERVLQHYNQERT